MAPADQASPRQAAPVLPDLGLVDALAQLSFLVYNTLAEIAREHDLSVVQTRLLGVLRDREPPMIVLGQHLGLDKSSISGLVDRAERRGLVTRTANAADRRSLNVTITDDGRELVERVGALFSEQLERHVATLAPEQRELLTRLAAQVVGADGDHREIDLHLSPGP